MDRDGSCSLRGLYPIGTLLIQIADRQGDYKVMSHNEHPYENSYGFDGS